MQYRSLPRYPATAIPVLGFGCMRLPVINRDSARIDEERAASLIRSAISRGVTYLDTAYPYHGGNSELFVGRLLGGGLREKVQLATKLPTWLIKTEADFERLLDEQLDAASRPAGSTSTCSTACRPSAGTSSSVSAGSTHSSGRAPTAASGTSASRSTARRTPFRPSSTPTTGISARSSTTSWTRSTRPAPPDCCGRRSAKWVCSRWSRCAAGRSPRTGPRRLTPSGREAAVRRAPADWALRWVWDHPGVVMALSGMNAPEQLDANIATAEASRAGAMNADELALARRVRDVFQARMKVNCTTCGYCQPCPSGVVDSRRLLVLQHQRDVRRAPGGVGRLPDVCDGGRARRRPVRPVRRVRAEMPAADPDPGHAGGGARAPDADSGQLTADHGRRTGCWVACSGSLSPSPEP